ncbi:30S ribosomal protein S14 [bacterium]|nr:30S ribosomal protein S14 [bacterium]
MARKAQLEREIKRQKAVTKYADLRNELKAKGDYEGLQHLPRDASATRLHSRCMVTGRGRGYMRRFGVSRIVFREKALTGQIPGVKKLSW